MHAKSARLAASEALQARRGKTAERGYGQDWRRVRAAYLATHPLCEHCNAAPSWLVHHVLPLTRGGERLDPANLAALCGEICHGAIHGRIDHLFVEGMTRAELELASGIRRVGGEG